MELALSPEDARSVRPITFDLRQEPVRGSRASGEVRVFIKRNYRAEMHVATPEIDLSRATTPW